MGMPQMFRGDSARARSAASVVANVTKQKGRRLSVFLCRGKYTSVTSPHLLKCALTISSVASCENEGVVGGDQNHTLLVMGTLRAPNHGICFCITTYR